MHFDSDSIFGLSKRSFLVMGPKWKKSFEICFGDVKHPCPRIFFSTPEFGQWIFFAVDLAMVGL